MNFKASWYVVPYHRRCSPWQSTIYELCWNNSGGLNVSNRLIKLVRAVRRTQAYLNHHQVCNNLWSLGACTGTLQSLTAPWPAPIHMSSLGQAMSVLPINAVLLLKTRRGPNSPRALQTVDYSQCTWQRSLAFLSVFCTALSSSDWLANAKLLNAPFVLST